MEPEFYIASAGILFVAMLMGHLLSRYVRETRRRWSLAGFALAPLIIFCLATLALFATTSDDDNVGAAMVVGIGFSIILLMTIPWIAGLLLGYMNPWTRKLRKQE